MMERLKKIDLLDVVGWISESWDEVQPVSLLRSWRKLLDHGGNEFQECRKETENCELVDLLKKIPGCEEATDGDVGEWMGRDENGKLLGDSEIVTVMREIEEKDEEESEDEKVKDNEKMTHSEGLKTAEGMLCYFEKQGGAIPCQINTL